MSAPQPIGAAETADYALTLLPAGLGNKYLACGLNKQMCDIRLVSIKLIDYVPAKTNIQRPTIKRV